MKNKAIVTDNSKTVVIFSGTRKLMESGWLGQVLR